MPMKAVNSKYNTKLIEIGLNVERHRKLRGFTREELAEKADESRNTIANIENSSKPHSMALGTLFKIADALEIPLKKLFEFETEDY